MEPPLINPNYRSNTLEPYLAELEIPAPLATIAHPYQLHKMAAPANVQVVLKRGGN